MTAKDRREGIDTAMADEARGSSGARVETTRPGAAVRWSVNAVYAVLLTALAVLPPSPRIDALGPPDWVAHGAAYGLQAGLIYWASGPALPVLRRVLAGFVGAVAFGAITEMAQLLRPGRSVELSDLLANAAGALVVVALLGVIHGYRPRSSA